MTILTETSILGGIVLIAILVPLLVLVIVILIWILIVRAICKYMARKNAEAFDYDYLAERIAEETCKRMMIIEQRKSASDINVTCSNQNQGNSINNETLVQQEHNEE